MKHAISIPIVSFVVLAVVTTATPAAALDAGYDLYLPAVGTGAGVPPSFWYTTIWVYNPNDGPAEVQFSFLYRNQSNNPSDITHGMVVDPGEVVQIDDAVTTMFGIEGFGAIRALSNEPVYLTARIYSQANGQSGRNSSGQAFAAVPAERAIGTGDESDLLAVTNLVGGDFRYNIGFVETTGHTVRLLVKAFGRTGNSWISTSINLRPFEQMQMSVDQLFNNVIEETDNFRLQVSPDQGDGRVIVFGSRVANGSQDATTFEMTFPPAP